MAAATGTRGRTTAPVAHGRLVALAAAADEFSVSTKTIRRRIADGTVSAYRVGRLIRVDIDELNRALLVRVPAAR